MSNHHASSIISISSIYHQTFISQFSLEFSVHVVSMLSGLARFWQRELLSWMVPKPRLAVVFAGWARMGNLKP